MFVSATSPTIIQYTVLCTYKFVLNNFIMMMMMMMMIMIMIINNDMFIHSLVAFAKLQEGSVT